MSKLLSIAEVNATLRQCGCCEHPHCCPPQRECRGVTMEAYQTGFDDTTASDESTLPPHFERTKYLTRVFQRSGESVPATKDTFPGTSDEYISSTREENWLFRQTETADRQFVASVCNISTGPAIYTFSCQFSGGIVIRNYARFFSEGSWDTFLAYEEESVFSDVSGQRSDEHIQWEEDRDNWEEENPDYEQDYAEWQEAQAAWQAAMADWTAGYEVWLESYYEWVEAYNAWQAGGEVGDPPVEPEPYADPPEPPEQPPSEPEEPPQFYPPCTLRQTITQSSWERVSVGEGYVIRLIDYGSDHDNPYTYYTTGPVVINAEPTFEDPVTPAEFRALAEAWFDSHIEEAFTNMELNPSDSEYCPPDGGCTAHRFYGSWGVQPWRAWIGARVFKYRFKLNKCCGYKKITSGWREVYWPASYLQWLAEIALLGSDDPIPPPPVDLETLAVKKQWLWEGTPPLCVDSDSGDSESPNDSPYDHEAMWSNWSLLVSVPNGQEGRKSLKNYWQICYGSLRDLMPAVLGEVDLSDDEPDPFAP